MQTLMQFVSEVKRAISEDARKGKPLVHLTFNIFTCFNIPSSSVILIKLKISFKLQSLNEKQTEQPVLTAFSIAHCKNKNDRWLPEAPMQVFVSVR